MTWSEDYCAVQALQDYLRIPGGDYQDDYILAPAISAASRAIDLACGRQFGLDDTPTTRYYSATYSRVDRRWVVPIDDLMLTDGLSVKYDAAGDQTYSSTVTGHRLFPVNAAAVGKPYTSLSLVTGVGSTQYGVAITARFGWAGVPDAIFEATLLQASRFVARRDSPYGVAGSPDTGSELRLLSKLDPDVAVSVAPYRRTWAVAS